MSEWKAKRFWTSVTVAARDEGFAVLLDDRPVRTPAKAPLVVPTRPLAELIAAEWEAQVEAIDPTSMPATRTANVTIDKVAAQMPAVAAHVAEYGQSDLLCYRAVGPQVLVERQAQGWDPVLAWAHTALGAELQVGTGVMPIAQSHEAQAALSRHVCDLDPFALSGFSEMVSALGSLVLALATAQGELPAIKAWDLSLIDEHFQREQWGDDDEAILMETAKRAGFLHAVAFFEASTASS